jgi:hypothetical protein
MRALNQFPDPVAIIEAIKDIKATIQAIHSNPRIPSKELAEKKTLIPPITFCQTAPGITRPYISMAIPANDITTRNILPTSIILSLYDYTQKKFVLSTLFFWVFWF